MYGNDINLDTEITQLKFNQPRHCLERLPRIPGTLHGGVIEQRKRRQCSRRGGVKQRDLTLLFSACARLIARHRRINARRWLLGFFLPLRANQALASMLNALRRGAISQFL